MTAGQAPGSWPRVTEAQPAMTRPGPRSRPSAATTTRCPTCRRNGGTSGVARCVSIIVRCGQQEAGGTGADRSVLLEVVRDKAARALADADSRVRDEYSITTFPLAGPSRMLLIASRTRIADGAGAAAYLTRCRRLPRYLDQTTALLRAAARDGLLPVGPLVAEAISQLRGHLARPERDPLLAIKAPEGWAGAAAWRDAVKRVVTEEIGPAIGRYVDLLEELRPVARPPERASLVHVPGGVAAYAACVRNGTTLPIDPDELHRLGLSALAGWRSASRRRGRC